MIVNENESKPQMSEVQLSDYILYASRFYLYLTIEIISARMNTILIYKSIHGLVKFILFLRHTNIV